MCAAMLYPLVESSLPEDLLRVWQRNTKAINSSTSKQLDELMSFSQTLIMNEERIAMAISGFGLNIESTTNQDKFKKKVKSEQKDITTAAGRLATKQDKTLLYIL